MIGEDKKVWDRFVVKFPERFESVDYDFRVGDGETPSQDLEENYQRMVKMLSQHRIDAIGWIGDEPTIIEVKPRAVISALGQLQGYRILFTNEFSRFGIPGLLMVCEVISQDVRRVFQEMKIPIEVV